ncbi:hypothetical protein RFI_29519 [Reticulomyxa filosa]|uniref:Uncharacterized protein n=1 Tax=Reticulomyxa filosa TaxID=46433 RepID=X6M2S4_RETFI|nr:hypothetical protein RFI_29519 [Reticulomyxa filosa]|eukprot:ETO07871.1 hypothetical protein RFI_29519 [Reticulomyxa filosa]
MQHWFEICITIALAISLTHGADQISLNGSPKQGSVKMNSYNYYYFISQQSGNVEIVNKVVSGSPYGVWTYVGRDYEPYDGKSDWSQGAISGYPADFFVDNIQINATYYISVQGIGNSDTYSLTAVLTPHSYIPPTQLTMNDQPWTSNVNTDYQYTDFYLDVSTNENFTVSVYVNSGDVESGDVVLLVSPNGVLPRTGNYEWQLELTKSQTWQNLLIPFAREGTYGISVWATHAIQFYIKAFTS